MFLLWLLLRPTFLYSKQFKTPTRVPGSGLHTYLYLNIMLPADLLFTIVIVLLCRSRWLHFWNEVNPAIKMFIVCLKKIQNIYDQIGKTFDTCV